jgi:hypothetical protein
LTELAEKTTSEAAARVYLESLGLPVENVRLVPGPILKKKLLIFI